MTNITERYTARIKQLEADLKGESNRAMIIIVTAHLDSLLEEIIKSHLIPSPNASDSLFEGANSVFSSFSNKIDISYRLGLISAPLCKSLHITRRIRNGFAHSIGNCSLKNPDVASRTNELIKLSDIETVLPDTFSKAENIKEGGSLFITLLVMIVTLENIAINTEHQKAAEPELFFKK